MDPKDRHPDDIYRPFKWMDAYFKFSKPRSISLPATCHSAVTLAPKMVFIASKSTTAKETTTGNMTQVLSVFSWPPSTNPSTHPDSCSRLIFSLFKYLAALLTKQFQWHITKTSTAFTIRPAYDPDFALDIDSESGYPQGKMGRTSLGWTITQPEGDGGAYSKCSLFTVSRHINITALPIG